MASEQFSSGPAPQVMTPGTLWSGLVPNPIPQPPYVPSTKNDLDILFQPMFDEFFNPLLSVVSSVPAAAAQRPADPTSSPKYGMLSSDPVDTPMVDKSKLDEDLQGKQVDPINFHGMIGSLMYLTSSRPDLVFAVCMSYADADHARCQDTRCSTFGSAQFMGDKLVSWSSKKQKSTSAIALCCNNVQHSRSKHIDVRYHFIKEQVENGVLELYFVRTEYQLADIFKKAFPRERFNFLVKKLGMKSMSPETLKSLTEEEDE
ncbi:hypothetical protein Tco_0122891 [Tanacetum coccineum]